MSYCVLLTCCVNVGDQQNYRIQLYTQQIRKWLNYNIDIFVVESSGSRFLQHLRNPRLHFYSFSLPNNATLSSSQSEARSMLALLAIYRQRIERYTYVLKVTGRYFLPNLGWQLRTLYTESYDLYLQTHRNDKEKWQNSEYYLIRTTLLEPFLRTVEVTGLMEHRLYEFSKHKKYRFIGPFPNRIARGGDKIVIPWL